MSHANSTSRGNTMMSCVNPTSHVNPTSYVIALTHPVEMPCLGLMAIKFSMRKSGTIHTKYRVLPSMSKRVKMKLYSSGTIHSQAL